MSLPFAFARPRWTQLVLSLLVIGLGVHAAFALHRVDQDLRSMYSEYTLAAAELARISADVMRYRATIIQAIEASTKRDFSHIARSLPDQRAWIEQAVARYAATTAPVLGSHVAFGEDYQAIKGLLEAYFGAANHTMDLLNRLWAATSEREAVALRSETELYAVVEVGGRLIQVSLALDRLMERVTGVAQGIREEKSLFLTTTSTILQMGGVLLGLLNLFLGRIRPAEITASHRSQREASPSG